LQAQLQPHFLFNALNGIATPVRRDSMESLAFNWIQKVPAEVPA
jgi:LytS/YehU family sensor histidine kinase